MTTTENKKCIKCKEILPINNFHKDSSRKDGLNSCCKPCQNDKGNLRHYKNKDDIKYQQTRRESTKKWKDRNKDKLKLYQEENKNSRRNSHLKRTYGITLEEYDKMLIKQNGVCAICGNPETDMLGETTRSLAVDHSHESGEIRALLCRRCNITIGMVKDDISLLDKAKEYLITHKTIKDD